MTVHRALAPPTIPTDQSKKRCNHAGYGGTNGNVSETFSPPNQERGPPSGVSERAIVLTTSGIDVQAKRITHGNSSPVDAHASPGNQDTLDTVFEDTGGDLARSITNTTFHDVRTGGSPQESELGKSAAENNPSFIGDLDPHGIFLSVISPGQEKSSEERGAIGVWLQRDAREQLRSSLQLASNTSISSPSNSSNESLLKILSSCAEDQFLRVLPNAENFEALLSIYLEEVHPIFPAINIDSFSLLEDTSSTKSILKQVICLAASTSGRAANHLHLQNSSEKIQDRRDFTSRIVFSLKSLLEMQIVKDKLVLTQILTLMSFSTQLSDDNHSSAELAARAISYVHTLGLHLNTSEKRKDHPYVTTLFCCVWALDRLNAAMHGRPVLMHDRDFGRDLEIGITAQEPCFQLFLRVTLLLDKTISFYRPTAPHDSLGSASEMPAFDELLRDSEAMLIAGHLAATIEIYYHAVAMLSGRGSALSRAGRSSVSYLRQMISAERVAATIAEEGWSNISMLPILPYAMSLCLRVFYAEMQSSNAGYLRAKSRRQVLQACRKIRLLIEIFPSVAVIITLAEQAVQKTDEIHASKADGTQFNRSGISSNDQSNENHAHVMQSFHAATDPAASRRTGEHVNLDNDPDLGAMLPSSSGYGFGPALDDALDLDLFNYFDLDFSLDPTSALTFLHRS